MRAGTGLCHAKAAARHQRCFSLLGREERYYWSGARARLLSHGAGSGERSLQREDRGPRPIADLPLPGRGWIPVCDRPILATATLSAARGDGVRWAVDDTSASRSE